MKKLLSLLLFITISFSFSPPNSSTLKLEKGYKIIGTFSGDFNNENSFHLIIAKNTKAKQHELIPVNNKDGNLIRLKPIVFKKQPSIVSYHSKNNKISIIASYKEKKDELMQVIDLHLDTGTQSRSETFLAKGFKTAIRKQDKNHLLFSNKNNDLIVKTISNHQMITDLKIAFNDTNKSVLEDLEDESIDAVKTDEYVQNGSINSIKAYVIDNDIVLTRDDNKAKSTAVLRFAANAEGDLNIKSKSYGFNDFEKHKKTSTYVNNDKLFQLLMSKKKMAFNIINLSSDKLEALNLSDATITKKSKGFTNLNDFIKQATKGSKEPTVTVNTSKEGKSVIRADYVEKANYSYNYNWWWHHQWHHQMMMWQQQQMMRQIKVNTPTGFGPKLRLEDVYYKSSKHHYFEIVIDANNSIDQNATTETKLLKIDKKQHIEDLKDKKGLDHVSSVFLGDTFRSFVYDKKAKLFKFEDKQVDDKF